LRAMRLVEDAKNRASTTPIAGNEIDLHKLIFLLY
jgi:hypothetical protein